MKNQVLSHIVGHTHVLGSVTHTSFYNSGAPLVIALVALLLLAVWPRKRGSRG